MAPEALVTQFDASLYEGKPLDRISQDNLLEAVRRMLWRSRSARQPYETLWKKYEQFWRGKQDDFPRSPRYIFNRIYGIVEFAVATLVEGGFQFSVLPSEPGDEALADVLNRACSWSVRKASLYRRVRQMVRDGFIYGTGIGKLVWNPAAERGIGNIDFDVVDVFRFFSDPDGYDYDTWSWCMEEAYLDTGTIYRRWGVEVAGDTAISDARFGDSILTANRGTSWGLARVLPLQGSPGQTLAPRASVYKVWMRDAALANAGIAIDEELREKAKYPDWFYIVCTANEILEPPTPNPYPHGTPEYVWFSPNSISNFFYGISEIHHLMDPQKEYNRRRDQLGKHAEMSAYPKGFVSRQSGVNPQSMNNLSTVWDIADPNQVWYLVPPPLESSVVATASSSLNDMEEISGIHDVARGKAVSELTAGIAIAQMTSRSLVRPNAQMETEYVPMLQRLGEMMVADILAFWPLPRIVRLAGESRSQRLTPEDIEKFVNAAQEAMTFDVEVKVGTPAAEKAARREAIMVGAQLGYLDQQTWLETMEFPNAHEIIERTEKKKQEEMAQMQALQQQQQGQQPAANPALPEEVAKMSDYTQLPPELRAVFDEIARSKGPEFANQVFAGLQQEATAPDTGALMERGRV